VPIPEYNVTRIIHVPRHFRWARGSVDPFERGVLGGGSSENWNRANIVLARRPDPDSDAGFVQRHHSGRIVSSQPLHSEPLLIVDDREAVLTGLSRFFGLYFERIYVATTPQDAEVMLETHQPAALLCDYWLGDQHPVGTELIRAWRERYPCLKRVVLMSGTNASSLGDVSCADAVFQKPLNLQAVAASLLGKAVEVES
jgi:CheY-like chemotaxis protein